MASTLEKAIEDIREIQKNARGTKDTTRPRWPMIVLRSPKGWTGPTSVDGLQIEGTFRAHQVPLLVDAAHPDHVKQLESWMKSYKAEELFDVTGRLKPELAELAPKGDRRMGANPHANGGLLLRDLRMPDFHVHAVTVPGPGAPSRPRIRSCWGSSRVMWPNGIRIVPQFPNLRSRRDTLESSGKRGL